jgi:adenosylcobyric acid synthase
VLGVVPYVPDLHLPEEDSVALEQGPPAAAARVAVVRLPHVANFTDFAPLAADRATGVRYARRPAELGDAALVVLPGTKDTLADLRWLHASGFAEALRAHVARGGRLAGICGGFQMLGRAVADPAGFEGGGRVAGLGCLPVTTVLERPKVTRRVRARLPGSTTAFPAYEIHMGRTRVAAGRARPFAWVEDGAGGPRPDGARARSGRVWGTYLHGLFDAAEVRRALVPGAAPEGSGESYRALRERAYTRLAAVVRDHVDLAALRKLAGAT